ncbi:MULTISPECIES: hypothetical protein [unclassified Brevibacterium]|uniref:hypothetical protein n=1 Tax=unclassified Brevibacterium TaxID=2614124 RepID=UPI0018676340|nr:MULTISPECIES: hypothetical protein [unclassified Brevibacterium]
MLIVATDESVDLYHWEEAPWVEWVYLGWVVAGAAVAVWFLIMIVRRQRAWLPLTLLGVSSVGLIAGGFFVQIGQGTYTDDEGMWACPSSLNAMRITEANGLKLPEAIVKCRADAKRNMTLSGALAGTGILVAVVTGCGTSIVRKRTTVFADEGAKA